MTNEEFRCLRCGSTSCEEGFVDDTAQGRVRWIEGAIDFGLLGNTKKFGRTSRLVMALRCTNCSRLEMVAGELD